MFIENVGQFGDTIRYYMWGSDDAYVLARDALWIAFQTPEQADTIARQVSLKISFQDANPRPRLEPFDRLDTKISFFEGSDPDQWQTAVPVWGGVRYVDLYPGVDLEVASRNGRVVQRLVTANTANLAAVRVQVEGANSLITAPEQLQLKIIMQKAAAGQNGVIDYPLPDWEVSMPDDASARLSLPFAVAGQTYTVPLAVVPTETLTPAIVQASSAITATSGVIYSTLLGSGDYELGDDIAVDRAGNAYVLGSTNFLGLAEAPGIAWGRSRGYKVVAKLDPTGGRLDYLVFLTGGPSFQAIAVDAAGQVYTTGYGASSYPTTPDAYITEGNESELAYVTKLNAAGDKLLFSTFLSKTPGRGLDLALDVAGQVYVTGLCSKGFPTTAGAYNKGDSIFVVKLTATGKMLYSTCFGGSAYDQSMAIAVDPAGNVYLTGNTASRDFPTTPGAFDTSYNGGEADAFVLKLKADASALLYSTYLGGDAFLGDGGADIAVDTEGYVYVVGDTSSASFPTTTNIYQHHALSQAIFAAKLNMEESRLLYSILLNGDASTVARAMTLDPEGALYVAGYTGDDLPTTADALDRTAGGGDAYLIKVSPAGDRILYSTYLGGSQGSSNLWERVRTQDMAYGLAIDPLGDLYVAGYTYTDDYPTTPTAFSTHQAGRSDIFVTKLRIPSTPLQPQTQLPQSAATPPVTMETPTNEERLTVLVNRLNVRTGPGTDYTPMGQARIGDVFTVVGSNADETWYQVCCVKGEEGWVINDSRYIRVEK
ncbi:MAG: SBBP repeat-containing protein [Caldilineaceae bacterium]